MLHSGSLGKSTETRKAYSAAFTLVSPSSTGLWLMKPWEKGGMCSLNSPYWIFGTGSLSTNQTKLSASTMSLKTFILCWLSDDFSWCPSVLSTGATLNLHTSSLSPYHASCFAPELCFLEFSSHTHGDIPCAQTTTHLQVSLLPFSGLSLVFPVPLNVPLNSAQHTKSVPRRGS